MLLLPPISTRPDTLFPNTTLFRSDVVRVVTALAADDHVHRAQRVDAVGVLQRRRVLAGDFRAGAASARRAEEMRFDQRKVVFLLHPLHQHRTDHAAPTDQTRSEEHTSELQSLMRISYAVFCLKKKIITTTL